MEVKLSVMQINKLNNWIAFYSDEKKDAKCTGIYAGIKHVLEMFHIYDNVMFEKPLTVTVEQNTIDELIQRMEENSINALWNLGLASGICWTLELLDILKTDYSKTDREGF